MVLRDVGGAQADTDARAHDAGHHGAARLAVHEHRVAVARDRFLGEGEADEFARDAGGLLGFQCGEADEIPLLHLHEPAESGFQWRVGVVDVVAVECHPHLEAQRVAAAEGDGGDRAGLHQRLPELHGVLGAVVQLEAVLAGVAGARERHRDASDCGLGEPVVLDLVEVHRHERLQDLLRLGSLHGEQSDVVADVLERRVELRQVLPDVREILVLVGAVHDHHQVVGVAVHEAIVHERALLGEDAGVVHLADRERGHVVGRHVADELDGLRPADDELPHVTHVEHAAAIAHGVVLGGDARGVLDRHLEAGEAHQLGAGRDVHVVEGGALECCGTFGHLTGVRFPSSAPRPR